MESLYRLNDYLLASYYLCCNKIQKKENYFNKFIGKKHLLNKPLCIKVKIKIFM